MPSASASNGRASPVGDSAGVLLKHMYIKMSLNVSRPPVTARSQRPAASSSRARLTARQRAGAGGVDDAVGAAQVEAVGDPAGDDVAEQAGERVLLPADVRRGDPLDDVLGGRLVDARGLERASPDRVAEPGAQGDDQLERAGDAEDDADAVAVERATRA